MISVFDSEIEFQMNTTALRQNDLELGIYQYDDLQESIGRFLYSARARNLSKGTIEFYQKKLSRFLRFCNDLAIDRISQLTADVIRQFMIFLEETGHNPGGIHAFYRAIRTFLRWFEEETEPDGWRNPIKKVRAPVVPLVPLDPISVEAVRSLLATCQNGSVLGLRDTAILLILFDSGLRMAEFLALDCDDVDLITGVLQVRSGKGRKPRLAFLGEKSRRALRRYLKTRRDSNPALWISKFETRLTQSGLQMLLRRRARQAHISAPSPHDFRRGFALERMRAGVDLLSLAKLMGHSSLQVLNRYVKMSGDDLQRVAQRSSPVDLNF